MDRLDLKQMLGFEAHTSLIFLNSLLPFEVRFSLCKYHKMSNLFWSIHSSNNQNITLHLVIGCDMLNILSETGEISFQKL